MLWLSFRIWSHSSVVSTWLSTKAPRTPGTSVRTTGPKLSDQRTMSGFDTQIGRSRRTEPLSRVSSWKLSPCWYVVGSAAASSVEAVRSMVGAVQTVRFI